MTQISEALRHQFLVGKQDFEGILLAHPDFLHEELAEELGLPHAEKLVSAKWDGADHWPQTDIHRIREAQLQYDAGLIELVTARAKHHWLLLRIIRVVPARPRVYFTHGMDR